MISDVVSILQILFSESMHVNFNASFKSGRIHAVTHSWALIVSSEVGIFSLLSTPDGKCFKISRATWRRY